jgi:hypothetical protein
MTDPTDDQIRAMLEDRADRTGGLNLDELLEGATNTRQGGAAGGGARRFALAAAAGVILAAVGLAGIAGLARTGGPAASGGGALPSAVVASVPPSVAQVDSQEPASPAAASPAAASQPPASQPVASKAAGTDDCQAAALHAVILGWTGAAGNRVASIRVTNRGVSTDTAGNSTGVVTCTLRGNPVVELVDASGRILISSASSSAPPPASETGRPLVLKPGASAWIDVDASNYCGPAPKLPLSVVLKLPGDAGQVRAASAASSGDPSFAVPPCMGSAPAVVSSNGWSASAK